MHSNKCLWLTAQTVTENNAQAVFSGDFDLLTPSSCAVKMGLNEAMPAQDSDLTKVVNLQRISHVGILSLLWKLTMTHSCVTQSKSLENTFIQPRCCLKAVSPLLHKCLYEMHYNAFKKKKVKESM